MSIPMFPLDKWMENVGSAALSSAETMWASYDIARLAIERGVPGDFVECGVFGGANAAAMARAIWEDAHECEDAPPRITRKVHLFDTFTGIPQAGPEDLEFLAAGHQDGLSACSMEAVQSNIGQWGLPAELFVYHRGRFSDTVPDAMNPWDLRMCIKEIAVLRLDGDLYESTRDAMELYPLVSPGGWVIVDDFSLSGCRKAFMESFEGQAMPAPIYFQKGR